MPRRLKIRTNEMGILEVYLIYADHGVYEKEWYGLQDRLEIVSLLPSVTKEVLDNALTGWTRPLVDSLGPQPKGMLLKLPEGSRECWSRETCPLHFKACSFLHKGMPWCFGPDGYDDEEQRKLIAGLISLWRESVYVLIVNEVD